MLNTLHKAAYRLHLDCMQITYRLHTWRIIAIYYIPFAYGLNMNYIQITCRLHTYLHTIYIHDVHSISITYYSHTDYIHRLYIWHTQPTDYTPFTIERSQIICERSQIIIFNPINCISYLWSIHRINTNSIRITYRFHIWQIKPINDIQIAYRLLIYNLQNIYRLHKDYIKIKYINRRWITYHLRAYCW